jgi:hypothetical protein
VLPPLSLYLASSIPISLYPSYAPSAYCHSASIWDFSDGDVARDEYGSRPHSGPRDAQSSLPDLVAFAFPPTIKTDADL